MSEVRQHRYRFSVLLNGRFLSCSEEYGLLIPQKDAAANSHRRIKHVNGLRGGAWHPR